MKKRIKTKTPDPIHWAAKLARIEKAVVRAAIAWKNQRDAAMSGVPQSAYSTRADQRLVHQIRRLKHERSRQAKERRAAGGAS